MKTESKGTRAKKPFRSPELVEFGEISSLTAVGKTNPGSDMHFGSVNPPGHDNRPGLYEPEGY
jgi:hypothetical protein